MPRRSTRPLAPVPRYPLTRREAAASLGVSINHFERKVQPELKVVLSGQLILIPVAELERWVQRHAHQLMQVRGVDDDARVGDPQTLSRLDKSAGDGRPADAHR